MSPENIRFIQCFETVKQFPECEALFVAFDDNIVHFLTGSDNFCYDPYDNTLTLKSQADEEEKKARSSLLENDSEDWLGSHWPHPVETQSFAQNKKRQNKKYDLRFVLICQNVSI